MKTPPCPPPPSELQVRAWLHEDLDQLTCRCLVARIGLVATQLEQPLKTPMHLWLMPCGEVVPYQPEDPEDSLACSLRILRHTPSEHARMRERIASGACEVDTLNSAWPPKGVLRDQLQAWLLDGNFTQAGQNLAAPRREALRAWFSWRRNERSAPQTAARRSRPR